MFNTYMGMLVWPMIALGWVVNLMQRGARVARAASTRSCTSSPPSRAPARPVALRAGARARSNSAACSMDIRRGRALDGIDLRIPAGATVAVVGHTGSGKSTLVSLVPRLMDPTAGAVLVDGVDVREFDPGELRRQIGFVPQETFLFSATIAENIAFGVEDATAGGDPARRRNGRPGGRYRGFPGRLPRPWWASAASRFPAARSSAPPSPAPFCAIRAF